MSTDSLSFRFIFVSICISCATRRRGGPARKGRNDRLNLAPQHARTGHATAPGCHQGIRFRMAAISCLPLPPSSLNWLALPRQGYRQRHKKIRHQGVANPDVRGQGAAETTRKDDGAQNGCPWKQIQQACYNHQDAKAFAGTGVPAHPLHYSPHHFRLFWRIKKIRSFLSAGASGRDWIGEARVEVIKLITIERRKPCFAHSQL